VHLHDQLLIAGDAGRENSVEIINALAALYPERIGAALDGSKTERPLAEVCREDRYKPHREAQLVRVGQRIFPSFYSRILLKHPELTESSEVVFCFVRSFIGVGEHRDQAIAAAQSGVGAFRSEMSRYLLGRELLRW
jgi:hypothetical protein